MICLWDYIAPLTASVDAKFNDRDTSVALSELVTGSTFDAPLESLRGRSILIATYGQLATALALIELDGVARRMVLCTPDLTPEQLAGVAATAQADTIVLDMASSVTVPASLIPYVVAPRPIQKTVERHTSAATEWILLTSGTTGIPKLVVHSLESLSGKLSPQAAPGMNAIWSTFYDIRRYGGLQIYLRAVLSSSTLVLSNANEAVLDFISRAASAGVTHISGTPSHWRRALMSGQIAILKPQYVRLSGEIADQGVLDNLRTAFPEARIVHAFASTEAGLAFDVHDGLAGFPLTLIDNPSTDIALKVVDDTLRIRSNRNATRYLGLTPSVLVSEDGYVDTGDRVELIGDRYYFRGRVGGVINVGGMKVHPEEVESVLNADPRVRMSLVRARRNPITGAVVVADVVLANPSNVSGATHPETIKDELLESCRRALPAHKVPAILRFVSALEFTAAGKLVRPTE